MCVTWSCKASNSTILVIFLIIIPVKLICELKHLCNIISFRSSNTFLTKGFEGFPHLSYSNLVDGAPKHAVIQTINFSANFVYLFVGKNGLYSRIPDVICNFNPCRSERCWEIRDQCVVDFNCRPVFIGIDTRSIPLQCRGTSIGNLLWKIFRLQKIICTLRHTIHKHLLGRSSV